MNKYEAAIAYFKERKAILAGASFEDEAVEHINTAIEAMKKQVPRAIKKHNYEYEDGECRFCGSKLNGTENYCGSCGQKKSSMLSSCTLGHCIDCYEHTMDGPVCENYAEKADETRRIHEES